MADPYTTLDDTIRKTLANSRAADAASYRAGVAQGNSWSTPGSSVAPPDPLNPPKPPVTAAAPAAAAETAATAGRAGMQAAPGIRGLFTLPGAAAAGGIAGAVGSLRDINSGYRDQFNDSVGAESPLATFGADVARTFGNVGNAVTGGIAGRVGQGLSNVMAGGSFGDGFSATSARDAFYDKAAGPVTAASKAGQKVASVAQSNPELFDSPVAGAAPGLAGAIGTSTSAPGITRLTGGQFRTPMFTDDPARAANQASPDGLKGGGFMPMPSSADGDRRFLAAAFMRHAASGDLERALATADPNDPVQQAALGIMLRNNQQAQAQAANEEPLRRMLMDNLNKSPRERALSEDVRTRAFNGVSGRLQPPAGDGGAGNMQALMQAIAANQPRSAPEASPMMQALAQAGAQQAQQQTAQAGLTEQLLKQSQAQSASIMANLQAMYARETDPKKREAIGEQLQVLSGKYDKSATQQTKLFPFDVDTGQKDVMGQPIYKKGLYDPESKQIVGGAPPAAKPTRESLDAEAKAAIAAGADKAAVNARLQQKIKELGL